MPRICSSSPWCSPVTAGSRTCFCSFMSCFFVTKQNKPRSLLRMTLPFKTLQFWNLPPAAQCCPWAVPPQLRMQCTHAVLCQFHGMSLRLQLPTVPELCRLGSGPGSPPAQSQLSAAPRICLFKRKCQTCRRGVCAQPLLLGRAVTELTLLGMEACAALGASASLSVLSFASSCFF